MDLHERLKYAREAKKITQEQAASLLRRSLRTIQNHESGQNRPPGRMLQAYADIYGCSYRWLVTGDEAEGSDQARFAADGEGLWGKTGPVVVDGVESVVTLFEPKPFRKSSSMLGQAVDMMRAVLDSQDQGFIKALMSNLAAFSGAVEREKAYRARVAGLESKCDALEKQVADQAREIQDLKRAMKLLDEKLSGFCAPRQDPESQASGET